MKTFRQPYPCSIVCIFISEHTHLCHRRMLRFWCVWIPSHPEHREVDTLHICYRASTAMEKYPIMFFLISCFTCHKSFIVIETKYKPDSIKKLHNRINIHAATSGGRFSQVILILVKWHHDDSYNIDYYSLSPVTFPLQLRKVFMQCLVRYSNIT